MMGAARISGDGDGTTGLPGGTIISCEVESWFTDSAVISGDFCCSCLPAGGCDSGCTIRVMLPGFASSLNHVDDATAGACGAGDTGLNACVSVEDRLSLTVFIGICCSVVGWSATNDCGECAGGAGGTGAGFC